MAKQALGKGLGALIGGGGGKSKQESGDAVGRPGPGDVIHEVPIDEVVASPMQPRSEFADEHLEELMESIREKGIIQPLIVRVVDGHYELIAGERRWRASQKLGLPKVKVIIREASDQEVLEMALIENLQREDLNPIEEARAYARLASDFGMRQDDIAARVGKNRATVANVIRLLDLGTPVQGMVESGEITVGHAKVILGLDTKKAQLEAAREIVDKKLSVRAFERYVQSLNAKPKKKRTADADPAVAASIEQVESQLQQHFGTKVQLKHGDKRGTIELDYYGTDDLNRLLGLMGLAEESFG